MLGPPRRWAPLGLAALFGVSGVLHLVRPEIFAPLIPRDLPAPGAIIFVSGIAELVCAAGLVTRRSWAGPASAALLVAILPGNIHLALELGRDPVANPAAITLAWVRIPFQVPLIWAALQARTGVHDR